MICSHFTHPESCLKQSSQLRLLKILPSRQYLEPSLVVSWCGDATGIQWVKISDAAQHPAMPKRAPPNEDLFGPSVDNAKVESPVIIVVSAPFSLLEFKKHQKPIWLQFFFLFGFSTFKFPCLEKQPKELLLLKWHNHNRVQYDSNSIIYNKIK